MARGIWRKVCSVFLEILIFSFEISQMLSANILIEKMF